MEDLFHYRWPEAKKTPNRLINIHTLAIEESSGFATPYAILSHRWSEEETSFEVYYLPEARSLEGYVKIESFCRFIKVLNCSGPDGRQLYTGPLVEWVWVDTCCIDKRSSAELSEAVNSMAAWYKNAAFCVAYLPDVEHRDDHEKDDWAVFRQSEWFLRGWTLQELVFPPSVLFCDRDWHNFLWMGPLRKRALTLVSEISGIPARCLRSHRGIFEESLASRMSWAADRKTTRKEDEAYCLLGLLDINMPLIYGEGERAFTRLQEEIIKRNNDESIFAWTIEPDTALALPARIFPLLATSPAQFKSSGGIVCRHLEQRRPYTVTNQGLELRAGSVRVKMANRRGDVLRREIVVVQLNCCFVVEGRLEPYLMALVKKEEGDMYRRIYPIEDVWKHVLRMAMDVTFQPLDTFNIAVVPIKGQHLRQTMNEAESSGILTLRDLFKQHQKKDSDSLQASRTYEERLRALFETSTTGRVVGNHDEKADAAETAGGSA